jgi:hypothetical protein
VAVLLGTALVARAQPHGDGVPRIGVLTFTQMTGTL